MTRFVHPPVLAMSALVLILSVGLGSCGTAMLDQLPAAVGGEPANLPARPKTPYQYPAVHDMPPVRSAAPLDDNQQVRMEKELQQARDRQIGLYGKDAVDPVTQATPAGGAAATPATAPAPAAKKKASDGKSGQSTGAKANP